MQPFRHRRTRPQKSAAPPRRAGVRGRWAVALPASLALPAAQSEIIYTDLNAGYTVNNSSGYKIYFAPTYAFASYVYYLTTEFQLYFVNLMAPTIGRRNFTNVAQAYGNYAANFSFGALIDGNSTFGTLGYLYYTGGGQWSPGTRGYVGLALANGDFGWADVEFGADQTLTLYGFAYEDSGGPIAAGVIPEPAETAALAALLAGSAAAFAARRRRKAARAAAGEPHADSGPP